MAKYVRAVALAALAAAAMAGGIGSRVVRAQSGDAQAAMAAALRIFHGVAQSDCTSNNPQGLGCVELESDAQTVMAGIADFGVSDPAGMGGFHGILGRSGDGSWNLWFTSQNAYQLLYLPGDMVVCAFGDGLTVRSGPSTNAAQVDVLADGARVTGQQFQLSDPGSGPRQAGFGWFRISAPEDGWVYSKYLEAAALAATDHCVTHDAQVQGP
jgi:hypothetical protein